jgi:hypothetical protein
MEASPQKMGNGPLDSGGMKLKSEAINRSPLAIPASFRGLSLVRKSPEAGAVPGIAFAISMKRKTIGRPGKVKCRSIKRRKDQE